VEFGLLPGRWLLAGISILSPSAPKTIHPNSLRF
jgi:hypothetical protein